MKLGKTEESMLLMLLSNSMNSFLRSCIVTVRRLCMVQKKYYKLKVSCIPRHFFKYNLEYVKKPFPLFIIIMKLANSPSPLVKSKSEMGVSPPPPPLLQKNQNSTFVGILKPNHKINFQKHCES